MNYPVTNFFKRHALLVIVLFSLVAFAAFFSLVKLQGSLDPRSQAAIRKTGSVFEMKKARPVVAPAEILFGSRASYERYKAAPINKESPARVNIFSDTQSGGEITDEGDDPTYVSNLALPMTATVTKIICPAESKDADCQYFGGDGIQKAINESPVGSADSATQLLLKQGYYFRENSEQFDIFDEKGQKQTRDAYYLIGGINGNAGKYIILSSLNSAKRATLNGMLVFPAYGLVVTGGRVDIKGINVQSYGEFNCKDSEICKGGTGIFGLNDAKLHIEDVLVDENRIGLNTIDNVATHVTRSSFRNHSLWGIRLSGYSSAEIYNITVEGGENGVDFRDNTRAGVADSSIKNVKDKGIQLLQQSQITFAKLTIEGAREGVMTFNDSQAKIYDITAKDVKTPIAASNKSQIFVSGLIADGGISGISSYGNSRISIARGSMKNITNDNVGVHDQSHMDISRLSINGGGAGLVLENEASVKVLNSTFYGNTDVGVNLGCHKSAGNQTVDFINNIVANTKKQYNYCGSGYAYNFGGKSAQQSITVRDFRGNWAFNSATQDFGGFEKFTQWLADDKLNRVGDPQFVNALAGDFHLRPGSPALTAGVDGKEVGAFGEAAEDPYITTMQKTEITLVSQDGTTAYKRECEGQRGIVDASTCGPWVTYDLGSIRAGVPAGQTYAGISSIVYNEDFKSKVLLQSLLDKNTSKAWHRRCRFKFREQLHYNDCTDWSEVDTSSVSGVVQKTIGIEAYVETMGEKKYYVQSLITADGVSAYSRTCEMTTSEILFRGCSNFKKVDLSAIKPAGDATKTFTDLDSWYTATDFHQAILINDGTHFIMRSCPFVVSGVRFRQCTPFVSYSFGNYDNQWNEALRIGGIDSFTYEY